MNIAESIFWERLSQSGLFNPSAANSLRTQFPGAINSASPHHSGEIVAWLLKGGLISEFQGKLLLGGFASSFSFGEYTLLARRANISGLATFAARHTSTRHDVQLCFVGGSSVDDLKIWQAIDARANTLRKCVQANLLLVHETVELSEYRFVVLGRSTGQSIDERLGRKGRIPWAAACNLVAHLANAVEEIHAHGLAHGNVNGHELFLESNGDPRLAPPIWPSRLKYGVTSKEPKSERDPALDYVPYESNGDSIKPADDIYALGVLLYRATRGETPNQFLRGQSNPASDIDTAIARLAKYDVPVELQELLRRVLTTKAADRIATIADFREQLRLVPQWKATHPAAADAGKSSAAYHEWLDRWRPKITQADATWAAPKSSETSISTAADPIPQSFKLANVSNDFRRRNRKTNRTNWIIWITSAAALVASLFAISKAVQRSPKIAGVGLPNTPVSTLPPVPKPEIEIPSPADIALPTATNDLIQKLVADNGNFAWQSPTNGPTIDLSLLPPGAAVIVIVRPRDMIAQPESSRISQALGSEFQSYIFQLETKLAVPFQSIDQLIVGYYPTEQQIYESFHIVRLAEPLDKAALVERWSNAGFVAEPDRPHFWSSGQRAFGMRASSSANTPISEFVCGSCESVEVSLQISTKNPLSGPLAQLVARTDRDRHLTILALKAGLANEMGQRLLPPRYGLLRQQIPLLIEEQVRAIAFSFHLDNGTFVELLFDQTSDIKSAALRDAVAAKFNSAREQATAYVATLPADPHWEKVRQRFDTMLTDLSRHLRFGVEYDQVIINAWLPPMAAHNLLAATDLTLSVEPTAAVAVNSAATPRPPAPTNVDQLLQSSRTLQNDNPPDLNILIDTLQTEIMDDFPVLPFAFEIRLSNTDLGEAGITRNQRLTSLALVDQSLAQVLTQICFQANPDKNATGPDDPRCKLIWVITRDEAKNTDLILITTRAAANKNGWKIPENFGPVEK